MIYSDLKYISKTQILKLLLLKKQFIIFNNKEAITIDYNKQSYKLYHIEDVYNIIKENQLELKPISNSLYQSFLKALVNKEEITFNLTSSLRYCKNTNLDVMISKESLEGLVLKNKKLKQHYQSLKCFTIINKIFFDTEYVIELLLKDKLDFSTKESDLKNEIKKIILYHNLVEKLDNKEHNKLIKI